MRGLDIDDMVNRADRLARNPLRLVSSGSDCFAFKVRLGLVLVLLALGPTLLGFWVERAQVLLETGSVHEATVAS